MDEVLRFWLANPREWHAHPYTILWGFLAAAIVAVLLGVFFWLKGKWWP